MADEETTSAKKPKSKPVELDSSQVIMDEKRAEDLGTYRILVPWLRREFKNPDAVPGRELRYHYGHLVAGVQQKLFELVPEVKLDMTENETKTKETEKPKKVEKEGSKR